MKTYEIHKIGGAGLMLPFQKLFDLVRYILKNDKPDTQIIIVVSAFAGITRILQSIFEEKRRNNIKQAMLLLESLKRIHLKRCKDLSINDSSIIYEYLYEIEYFIMNGSINEKNPSISKAHLLKFGELLSSEIFHQFLLGMKLHVNFFDAREVIICSGKDYCNSEVLQPETSEAISKKINTFNSKVLLTHGFIARGKNRVDKLLGFDGSDLTASLLSFALHLCGFNCNTEITYWKDVEGVLVDGNIREEINGDGYDFLPTVPVRKDSISVNKRYKPKIFIRSFLNLNHPGTLITW